MADESKRQERRKMTRAEAGRKGGTRTRERYGSQFFREIGRIGGSRGSSSNVRRSFGEPAQRSQSQEAPSGEQENGALEDVSDEALQ
jgi:general stress protein YciG